MEKELSFLNDLGVDLGQARSREVLALYLKGLRICSGRRTLANIAGALCPDDDEARRLVDRFNYQLNDRQGRSGIQWAPQMMQALAKRATSRLREDRLRAYVLVAMRSPRLGSGVIKQADVSRGTAQMVAALFAVGHGPTMDLEALPIGWRIAFDGWTINDFERASVPMTHRHTDHISIPAGSMLAGMRDWRVPDLPIVASGPFAELRFLWLAAGRRYVVQWKSPHRAATAAIAQHAGASPSAETITEEIEQRRQQYWRQDWVTSCRTRLGLATRTELLSPWRTCETDLQVGELVLCAHLPDASDAEIVTQMLDYDKLRNDVRPVYQERLRSLGLDDYRGNRFSGWHAHRALVSAAHLLNREEAWPSRGGY